MKLGVMKMPGHIPGAGYHYKLFPKALSERECVIWAQMGYIIIDVQNETQADRLLEEAQLSLRHEVEIAALVEKENLK